MVSFAAGSLSCSEDSPPPSGREVTVVVLKQLGAGPELVHCHATLMLEKFMTSAVTSVGVGGAGAVLQTTVNLMKHYVTCTYLLLVEKSFSGHLSC